MKKKFDTVKFQRVIREELSEKYSSNREAFLRELKEKYGNLQKRKAGTHNRITSVYLVSCLRHSAQIQPDG
jgi:hypothetical protein